MQLKARVHMGTGSPLERTASEPSIRLHPESQAKPWQSISGWRQQNISKQMEGQTAWQPSDDLIAPPGKAKENNT
uniref:Uncharacterized protein n=1 Tax=Sphaerodactylus townsendi TaxID=933632 RepID=A0ACB8EC02_9SAUR